MIKMPSILNFNMRFLAINSAGKGVEVVVFDNGRLIKKCDSEFKKASAVLLPFVDNILNESFLSLKDMDFLSCCIGPGSFTGIRIGAVTIRSLADAMKKKVVGVTFCDILAYTDLSEQNDCDRIVTISDASNGYIYVATFDSNRNVINKPQGILTCELGQYLDCLKNHKTAIVCEHGTEGLVKNPIIYRGGGDELCKAVQNHYKKFGAAEFSTIEPIYIRTLQADRDLALKQKRENVNG